MKLPPAIARQIEETDARLIIEGAAPEMHVCGTAMRRLREIWADRFQPGWSPFTVDIPF